MSRDPLDDLTDALSVQPSAEFEANVRRRLAGDPMRRVGWSAWWIPVGIVTAATIAVLVIGLFRTEPPVVARAVLTASPLEIAPIGRLAIAAPADITPVDPRTRTRGVEPEVLVPPEQEAALKLIARAAEGRIDTFSLLAHMTDSAFRSTELRETLGDIREQK